VVVGDTCVSEHEIAIIWRDKRCHVCCGVHGFNDAEEPVAPKITEKLPHSDKGIR
jgi:hypothetical protein